MRAVNLMPRDLERERPESRRVPMLVAAGGVAAVTVGAVVLYMSAASSVSDQRSQLDSVEAAIAQTPAARQHAVVPSAIALERTNRVAALSAALATRVPLDRLLLDVALVLPEDAWLTGLTATAPAPSTPATSGAPAPSSSAQGVTIEGATYSNASVARVLARFAAVPSLDNVRLTASTRTLLGPGDAGADGAAVASSKKRKVVVTFTITASLRTGSAA